MDIESFRSPLFVLKLWNRLSNVPGGKLVFGKVLARVVPYSDTIHPQILELRPGYARISMKDTRAVRNHLSSVHAVAMTNLAELTSGLALTCGLPEDARGILKTFSIEFLKKGHGTLTAASETVLPKTNERQEMTISVETRDSSGALVTRAQALWLIGPKKSSGVK